MHESTSCRNSAGCQCVDLRGTGFLEHRSAGIEGRAGGADIVYHDNSKSLQSDSISFEQRPPQSEGPAHVRLAALGWQLDLRDGVFRSNQSVDHRRSEASRELPRLIEASRTLTSGMQRYWNDTVRLEQQRFAGSTHQPREPSRERVALLVFQRMNDLAQRAVVFTNRAGPSNDPRMKSAGAAYVKSARGRGLNNLFAESWKRVATHIADGRRDRVDRHPAISTHTTLERHFENCAAYGTRGRQQRRDQSVCGCFRELANRHLGRMGQDACHSAIHHRGHRGNTRRTEFIREHEDTKI